jgi:diguanylate cyclase (GGDEF)-like protein
VEGELEVQLEPSGANLNVLHAGECVGEMSVMDNNHTSAWVTAVKPTRLMQLDSPTVWALITHSHIVAVNLLSILSDRVRSDNVRYDKSQQLKSFYGYHAKVDALTGLHNRRWLDTTLERLSRRPKVNFQPLTLIMLDADHFKNYNDSHGHLAGDAALNGIAGAIQDGLRPVDLAARYGGEEFVVVLPDTGLSKAIDVAERLREAISARVIKADDGRLLPGVTVSLGVASVEDGQDPDGLLAAADAALYRSKQQGRDRVSS